MWPANKKISGSLRYKKGTTFMETIIAVSFFVGVSLALYGIYGKIIEMTRTIRLRELIATVANEQIEIIRNLPYSDVGTIAGVPNGVVPPVQDLVRQGYTFRVDTYIRNIDQSYDGVLGGLPNDLSPADNKLVEIKVRCDTCNISDYQTFTTTVAPKNLETSSTNGALFVYVIDASGQPVSGANLYIDNVLVDPEVHINDNTNASGVLQIVDTLPSVESYEIIANKSGYTQDMTYSSLDLAGSIPVLPHMSVAIQQISQVTLVIDKVSSTDVTTVDSQCNAVPNFEFNMTGTKKIGTSPDVYKYSEDLTTGGSGSLSLDDLEWDTYTITPIDNIYDLIGSNPLLQFTLSPNSSQNLQLVVAPVEARTLLVTVKDSSTGLPLTDATVTLSTGGSDIDEKTTGRGSFTQTDWSGSGGVEAFVSGSNDYFDTDGNLETSLPGGELKLEYMGGEYSDLGYITSSTFDTGSASNFYDLVWGPTDQAPQVGADSVKFQVASNNDNLVWNFVGPDGTNATYYTLGNQTLSSVHNGNRYLRIRTYLSTEDTSLSPNISDVSFTYTASCTPPGQVAFQDLSAGTHTVTVSKDGYNTAFSPIDMSLSWQQIEFSLSQ